MKQISLKKRCLDALDAIAAIPSIQNVDGFSEVAQHFRARIEDDEFRIAVVGEFSSGKSTFINAIIGRDLLPHATKETTAALTRIVNVARDDPRVNSGLVELRSGEQITLSTLDDLAEYTTTMSKTHQVVEDVVKVELYLPVVENKRRIVIVDTPGLNGVADGHREQTVALIQQAHACVYMLQRHGLAESDVEFLNYLKTFQHNFIFVQNFIDDLNAAEGDSLEKILDAQDDILKSRVFTEDETVNYQLCGVSGLYALAAFDERVQVYSGAAAIGPAKSKNELLELSRFEGFRQLLADTFRDDRLDRIQYGSTAAALYEWVNVLLAPVELREKQVREVYEASRDRYALEKLDRLGQKVLENKPRQQEYLQNFVTGKLHDIGRELSGQLSDDIAALEETTGKEIDGFEKLKDLEQWRGRLPSTLRIRLQAVFDDHGRRYAARLQSFYQVLLARISQYSGINSQDIDKGELRLEALGDQPETFAEDMSEIVKLEKQIQDLTKEQAATEKNAYAIRRQLRDGQSERDSLRSHIDQLDIEKENKLQALGIRPQAKQVTKYRTEERYRGGFGILDALFGPKLVSVPYTETDDTLGQRWDRETATIKNQYLDLQANCQDKLNAIESRLQRLNADMASTQAEQQNAQQGLKRLQERWQQEKQTLQAKKDFAAREYLKQCKALLKQQIHTYLLGDDGVLDRAKANLTKNLQRAQERFTLDALQRFDRAVEQKLAWIEQAKTDATPKILRQAQELATAADQLRDIQTKMEEWLQ